MPIESAVPLAKPSRSHLLPADRLPRLGRDLTWARTTDDAGGGPVGACQRASLVDIGALDAVRRTSETADGRARVTQVVARFPDRTSTWRAHEVLRSWRADCAEELGGRRSDVGALEPVPVRTGHGEAYVAAYRPSDGSAAAGMRTAGLGIVRKGSWLVVVEVATDARTWPSGWDPTRKAVRRIAATFEG
ncbi:hypothetical protein [Nocardioides sp. SYSU DS0663]|uniref:hypothetical protein n=1 Tax=Nocardioides sp. SYSU DS0663 TaxID=3416445 RepID=UPI003F4CA8F5